MGSITLPWRKTWTSELDALLFAENTASLMASLFIVPYGFAKNTVAIAASSSPTAITLDNPNLAVNDFLVFRGTGAVEYMQVTAAPGGGAYTVTRNLDGTGANAWPVDSVAMVIGYNGDGRIELDATTTPRISMKTIGTASYSNDTEQLRLGDLASAWGYSATPIYGLAVGPYASGKANITIDPSNGIRIRNYGTNLIHLDGTNAYIEGTLSIGTGGALASGATSYSAGTGYWMEYNSGTPRFRIGNPAGNRLTWDGTTLTLAGEGSGITNINGGNIQAHTVTATEISVTTLSAISASMGSLTMDGVISIGAAGGIYQGSSGTFAAPNTGFKLYQTSSKGTWEVWSGGTKQVYIDTTDMSLRAGGGAAWLDSGGLGLDYTIGGDQAAVKWLNSGTTFALHNWNGNQWRPGNAIHGQ